MNDAVLGGGHPHQDLLADLAAGVLPPDQAPGVEAHVMSCGYCAQFLADTERVRSLLSVPDPGPMPDDVWDRIDRHLAAESAHQTQAPQTGSWFADAAPVTGVVDLSGLQPGSLRQPGSYAPAAGPPAAHSSGPAGPSGYAPAPAPSFDEAPTAAWQAFVTEPPPPPPAPAAVPQRMGRAVASMRSRRDVRAEDKGEPRWWTRPWPLAAAAATLLAVVGLGGWAAVSFWGDDPNGDRFQDNLRTPSASSVFHASGVDYTAGTLAQQATALVTGPTRPVTTAKPPASGSATGSATSRATGSATGSPKPGTSAKPSPPGASAVPVKPGTVSDPAQLNSCLRALGEADRQPLAVDIATYQGREAAVIVLPGKVGGYDIWVVARDCRPGAETPLAFKQVSG